MTPQFVALPRMLYFAGDCERFYFECVICRASNSMLVKVWQEGLLGSDSGANGNVNAFNDCSRSWNLRGIGMYWVTIFQSIGAIVKQYGGTDQLSAV